MSEYYGNNDWRDYLALKHYGVKGMKWGKRKKYKYEAGTIGSYNTPEEKSLYIRKDSTNNDYGHKIGIGYSNYSKYGGDEKISFYDTKDDKYAEDYWKNPSKYKSVTGGVLEKTYAEDGVHYSINISVLKKKLSSFSTNVRKQAKSLINSIFKKKSKRG